MASRTILVIIVVMLPVNANKEMKKVTTMRIQIADPHFLGVDPVIVVKRAETMMQHKQGEKEDARQRGRGRQGSFIIRRGFKP